MFKKKKIDKKKVDDLLIINDNGLFNDEKNDNELNSKNVDQDLNVNKSELNNDEIILTPSNENDLSQNELINDKIKNKNFNKLNDVQIMKLKLWEEQNHIDIYDGEDINIDDIFELDIDHILPYSISMDNSLSNKVLVKNINNLEKGNLTPFQWLTSIGKYEEFKKRVNEIYDSEVNNKKISNLLFESEKIDDLNLNKDIDENDDNLDLIENKLIEDNNDEINLLSTDENDDNLNLIENNNDEIHLLSTDENNDNLDLIENKLVEDNNDEIHLLFADENDDNLDLIENKLVENNNDVIVECISNKERQYIDEMCQIIFQQENLIKISPKMTFFKKRKAKKINERIIAKIDLEYSQNFLRNQELKEQYKMKLNKYFIEQKKYKETLFKL